MSLQLMCNNFGRITVTRIIRFHVFGLYFQNLGQINAMHMWFTSKKDWYHCIVTNYSNAKKGQMTCAMVICTVMIQQQHPPVLYFKTMTVHILRPYRSDKGIPTCYDRYDAALLV